jgi:hypothetical protein
LIKVSGGEDLTVVTRLFEGNGELIDAMGTHEASQCVSSRHLPALRPAGTVGR